MNRITLFIITLVGSLMLAVSVAMAGTHLGFTLGETTCADAEKIIRDAGGSCNNGYGYKGYKDLPMIKVTSFATFDKFGALDEAWLNFTPDRKLYRIEAVWSDAGQTFATLKDALDAKYGQPRHQGMGFSQDYQYRDGKVAIVLNRNTFGFGKSQKTTLTYTDTTALAEVGTMRKQIEEDIRNKNASKAAGDL